LGKGLEIYDTPLIKIENSILSKENIFINSIEKLLIDVNECKILPLNSCLEKSLSELELN
jgi:hypothetical protein